MSLPRIKVRALMALVALVAFAVWGWAIWQRSVVFAKIAREHMWNEDLHLLNYRIQLMARTRFREWKKMRDDPGWELRDQFQGRIPFYQVEEARPSKTHSLADEQIERNHADRMEGLRRGAAYEANLRRKYERAARHPWHSVEPDPIVPPSTAQP